jgi:hypothetical protein
MSASGAKRTFAKTLRSVKCHFRTHALQLTATVLIAEVGFSCSATIEMSSMTTNRRQPIRRLRNAPRNSQKYFGCQLSGWPPKDQAKAQPEANLTSPSPVDVEPNGGILFRACEPVSVFLNEPQETLGTLQRIGRAFIDRDITNETAHLHRRHA